MNYDLGNMIIKFNDYETSELITDINNNGEYNEGDDTQITYTVPGYEIVDINFTDNSCYNIPLDAIYTGKMMMGILDLVAKDYFPKESGILAIHTGGLQGNKGMSERLGTKLPS